MKNLYAYSVFLLNMVSSLTLQAQDLEPRSFTNLPVGETFVVSGIVYSDGNLAPAPSAPLEDAEITLEGLVIGAAHSFALAGNSAKVDAGVARICMEGSATFLGEFTQARRCGYTDPLVRLSWNFYGAPALALADFASWNQKLVLGTSLQVGIPVGTYLDDKLVNTGANRWLVKPAVGLSYKTGTWDLDSMLSISFFEDNDNFFNGIYVEQDPLYALQTHLTRSLRNGRWISINANFFAGGETSKDGIDSDDQQENSRFGITYSIPINSHNSLKFYLSTGVITRIGNDFTTFGMNWQYRL